MHTFWIILFTLVAVFWLFYGLRGAIGLICLPWLKNFPPLDTEEPPRISLVFAARDEQEKLPIALQTLSTIAYPNLEIIAVDDRSQDKTPAILDHAAQSDDRLRIIHVKELPQGWLGKPHALQKAYEAATGEWLLFTDADVRFAPDALSRAMTLVQSRNLDHLTLFGDVDRDGFWSTVLLTFFGLAMHLAGESHRVSNPNSRAYLGIGAFQLVRRTAYEGCGTHKRLAMEVVDDIKLGKILKRGGYRSCVGVAVGFVAVRWQSGFRNLIRGVTKNFFAALNYSVPLAVAAIVSMLLTNFAPFVAVIFGHGWVRILAGISVAIALLFHVFVDIGAKISPLYALTHPIGALIFCWMILRSMIVTLRQGGVIWRDTFYKLTDLRKGVV
ncbi:MAG TPA: glycosyltransferase family 2 protein [Candidatus Sulfotelmatobacter sp.]|nr:glycosyltransferase family 2 protein [Candidatus Sulfotelmatobacter sp.]